MELMASVYTPDALRAVRQQAITTLGHSHFEQHQMAVARLLDAIRQSSRQMVQINDNIDKNIGWPLACGESVLVHIGDVCTRDINKRILPLRSGDFYLSVSCDRNPQLIACIFNTSLDDFDRFHIDIDEFVSWLDEHHRWWLRISTTRQLAITNCLLINATSGVLYRCAFVERYGGLVLAMPVNESIVKGGAYATDDFCSFSPSSSSTPQRMSTVQLNSSNRITVSSSMMDLRLLKEIVPDMRLDYLHNQLIVFTGASLDDGDSMLIELHFGASTFIDSLLRDETNSEWQLARLLGYLQLQFSRSKNILTTTNSTSENISDLSATTSTSLSCSTGGATAGLALIIDRRRNCSSVEHPTNDNNLAVTKLVWQTISLLLQWIPDSVRRMFWIDDEKMIGDQQQQLDEQIRTDATRRGIMCESLSSIESLHNRIDVDDLSVMFDGKHNNTVHIEWIEMRQHCEMFLRRIRTLSIHYIDAHKEARRLTSNVVWQMDEQEIDNAIQLKSTIETSDCYCYVRDRGDIELQQLELMCSKLTTLPDHLVIKTLEKAIGMYKEVRSTMDKVSTFIDKRIDTLGMYKRARHFIIQLIYWADTVALPRAQRQADEPSVSLMRLRIQERQFETFVNEARNRLDLAEQLLLDCEPLKTNIEFNDEQRNELTHAWNCLVEKVDETNERLKRVHESLGYSLVCYHMLDRVYDWALYNAKWSCQLGLLIASATSSTSNDNEVRQLLASIRQQIDSYPSHELDQLPKLAEQLCNDQVRSQAESLAPKCLSAFDSLKKRELDMIDIIANRSSEPPTCSTINNTAQEALSRSISPTGTDYEQPIRRSSTSTIIGQSNSTSAILQQQQQQDIRWRRSSYAGNVSSSLRNAAEFYDARYRPCKLWTNSVRLDETTSEMMSSDDEMPSTMITRDMTDQVVQSMSANTLSKKISERRAANTAPLPPPNPLALIKGCRPGSARYVSKTKKPFCKQSKRSSTTEISNNPDIVVISNNPTVDQSQQHRYSMRDREPSLCSLNSIGDDSVLSWQSGSHPNDRLPIYSSTSTSPMSRAPTDDPIIGVRILALDEYRCESPPADVTPDQRMQYMIVNELLQTELVYVESLGYIIQDYIPEMFRADLPQELRGQRYTLFGNIEKLYEFHVNEFLPALVHRIRNRPIDTLGLEIGKLFYEFRARFHLYALYSKNKPKSEALMTECGGVFFRARQLIIGDALNLSSYLLKPLQRLMMYALLLKQLIKACASTDTEAADTLRRAEEMVTFQQRHGNDLLAMDLIVGCDVNLKEQGTLIRQDEFTVIENRGTLHNRKCIRRVFMFENLILFTKPKRSRMALAGTSRLLADTYQYKYSIQMSDCGLTESVRDSKVKFELWFRRQSSSTTYVLQAALPSTRQIWISEVTKLLWKQAVRNREQRNRELANMGIGERSSCVDLHSSADRIQDRSVSSSLLTKMARFRNSFVSSSSIANGYSTGQQQHQAHGKRPHSLISLGSSSCTSSNASSLGSGGGCVRTIVAHTPGSVESGICADLAPLDELPERDDTLSRLPPPPPPPPQFVQCLSTESTVVTV